MYMYRRLNFGTLLEPASRVNLYISLTLSLSLSLFWAPSSTDRHCSTNWIFVIMFTELFLRTWVGLYSGRTWGIRKLLNSCLHNCLIVKGTVTTDDGFHNRFYYIITFLDPEIYQNIFLTCPVKSLLIRVNLSATSAVTKEFLKVIYTILTGFPRATWHLIRKSANLLALGNPFILVLSLFGNNRRCTIIFLNSLNDSPTERIITLS